MINFKCKICGGSLIVKEGQRIATCEFCGTNQTLPIFDDEKKIAFYNRANSLRLMCDFDKAAGIYETIVTEFPNEAEAFWGLILCKYGIEYIEDKNTGKRIPTCHRTQFSSIYDDKDYQNAIKYSDVVTREIYENEAAVISKLQKNILEISSKEDPFDIFICYREKDENGNRTQDSVIAFDIYKELIANGYRVFFSKVTLESLLGHFYEPYIFSALHSAKLMVHVTTSNANSESVWVKNEWGRFLSLIKDGQNKSLISCFSGITPKELPKELQNIQGQDMSKIGAMQDLMYGINKIFGCNSYINNKKNDSDLAINRPSIDELEYEYRDNVQELYDLDSFCSYSSDVKPIIDFFERAIDYKDSRKHLKEAKFQYAKRVNSLLDCIQALKYLDEIQDLIGAKELKEKVSNKIVDYRKKELQNKKVASLTYEPSDSYSLCQIITSLTDRTNENKEELLDLDKQIIDLCLEETKSNISKFAIGIIKNENRKSELQKIKSALDKLKQCSINIENFNEINKIINDKINNITIAEEKEAHKKKVKKITVITSVIVALLTIVIITVSVITTKNAGYSSDNFTIEVVSKTNDKYNESLADGYTGSGYYYTFKFNVENNSPNDVTKIIGNMDVNNSNGKTLVSSTVTMTGTLSSKSDAYWNIQLNVYKGENAREIWNTNFESLEITFKITSITFGDGTTKNYSDTKNKIVHSIDKSSVKNNNQDNSNNESSKKDIGEMSNEHLDDLETLLGYLHNDVSNCVLVPDCEYDYISYSNNCGCYSADYSKDYVGSYVFFEIKESYVDSLVSDFKSTLLSNGWTTIYDDGYSCEYEKGSTHVVFHEIQESNVWDGYQYNFQYYYWNYYAFNVN